MAWECDFAISASAEKVVTNAEDGWRWTLEREMQLTVERA
jgi:hypothetical protein